MEHESDVRRRRWGCYLAEQLFRCSRAPYGDLVPVLLKNLLSRVAETDRALLQAVSEYCQRRDTQCRITQHIRIIHNTPSHNTPSLLTRHPLITHPTIMTLPPSLPPYVYHQVSDALSALSTANTVVSLDELATHLTFMQVIHTLPPTTPFYILTYFCFSHPTPHSENIITSPYCLQPCNRRPLSLYVHLCPLSILSYYSNCPLLFVLLFYIVIQCLFVVLCHYVNHSVPVVHRFSGL